MPVPLSEFSNRKHGMTLASVRSKFDAGDRRLKPFHALSAAYSSVQRDSGAIQVLDGLNEEFFSQLHSRHSLSYMAIAAIIRVA